jgi:hypothetical protein
MRRDECENGECGHSKATHYREIESTGDVNQERRYRYFGCLASFCGCEQYVAPKE